MEKKNVVLLTVIAVATLLTAMVGSTFAFFTASVENTNEEPTKIDVHTATATATYSDGSTISIDDIAPGWEGSKTITIQNTGTAALDYTISFEDGFSNGFNSNDTGKNGNFKYKLVTSGSGNNNASGHDHISGTVESFTQMGKSSLSGTTEANKNVLVTGHLEANEKHEFTLTFTLENITTGPQDDDQEKTFSAKLKAEAKAVESELEG